jgi:uncharacterized membrane protein
MTRSKVYWAVALALTAVTWTASVLLYRTLPERIPTHWNIHGQVDGYGSKAVGAFVMPAAMLVMLGIFWLLPYLSPKNFEIDTFHSTYLYIMATTLGLFAYIHAVTLLTVWQNVSGVARSVDIGRLLVGGIFLFIGLLGNVMGKIRRNFYIGVRVPWTLASDRVWNDTHRVAAWTMVAGSVIGFVIVISGLSLVLAFAMLILSALVPVVYSFVHYKRLEREGAL